ncbi:hypothetical protein BSPA111_06120 [Buttiauxella sp. A111]|nr:hypothetical protein BSPA111_06120 [Buttiauxella sp. A111]
MLNKNIINNGNNSELLIIEHRESLIPGLLQDLVFSRIYLEASSGFKMATKMSFLVSLAGLLLALIRKGQYQHSAIARLSAADDFVDWLPEKQAAQFLPVRCR